MSMTVEEVTRVRRLEERVDLLENRFDELIGGVIDTIKKHRLWDDNKILDSKNENKDEIESRK